MGTLMLGFALAGLAMDGAGLLLLAPFVRSDLNVRGVALHVLADAAGSLAAAVAAVLVVLGLSIADTLVGLVLAGFVGWAAIGLLRDVVIALREDRRVPKRVPDEQAIGA